MTEQNQSLKNVVEEALRQFGYPFEDMRGSIIFEVVTDGNMKWRTQAMIYKEERFIEINTYLTDDLYPEHRVSWVAELAARLTDTVPAGAFVFRFAEGDVRFRVVRAFGDEPITVAAIIGLLEQVAFPIRLWSEAFQFRYDDIVPEFAIDAALITEDAYSGNGLSNISRKAIMTASVASGIDPIPIEIQCSAVPSPLLKLV